MRSSMILCLFLLSLVCVPAATASTLDPGHPVWSQPGLDHGGWVRALGKAALERALPIKWHDPIGARGRVAAVGVRVLVIPVLPVDAAAPPRTPQELESLWAGPPESSVRGYWEFVSAGALQLEVRVLPWLAVPGTLQSDYPNVIDGNPAANLSAGPRNLARDALAAAARVVEDLHVFDDDGPDGVPASGDDDAVLDLVVVLHPFPGWETNPVVVPRAIVSLQSRLGGEPIPQTDLKADAFLVASASGPLGVWVHEFGHLLGLPDLYDLDRAPVAGTPGSVAPQGGLGRWSLMASGTWGGGGATPSGLDAWSRLTLGFGQLTELDQARVIDLPWVDIDEAEAVRLRPLGDWGEESWLIEARRRRSGATVDAELPGDGALVYRVRPDLSNNLISEKFVELLQSDDRDDLGNGVNDGDAFDPYDGTAGRDRLDGSTSPSSESFDPSLLRTPPSMQFSSRSSAMQIAIDLSAEAALRLESFGIADEFLGFRTWLRPGETGTVQTRWSDVGMISPVTASLEIGVRPEGRALEVSPSGPVSFVADGDGFVLSEPVTIRDMDGSVDAGLGLLELSLSIGGQLVRVIDLGLPVDFSDGLPNDAMARFAQEISAAPGDTTRFVRLPLSGLPSPAFVGYELQTDGRPGYANSVELSLVSDWFAVPPDGLAWVWARGSTETGMPGQAFDGAAVEVLYPDRGWEPLQPEGTGAVWIPRRSAAATRDRIGLGGELPDWASYSLHFPRTELPARVRVRFGSDASIAGGSWEVAGLQTDALPRAQITLDAGRSTEIIATARFTGDFSLVNLANYRYRLNPDDEWKPASGFFSIISSDVFSVLLSVLPDDVSRAQIGLFSGNGAGAFLIGSVGLRRDPQPRMPTLLRNPARGTVVLQVPDRSEPLALSVYDLRGRRRARLVIPARTTWFEWEPRSDGGELLSSGQYFLRADEMEIGIVRFIWFR
jgi:M6 family metalloprotease-like protein